jgi:hypothetical protein
VEMVVNYYIPLARQTFARFLFLLLQMKRLGWPTRLAVPGGRVVQAAVEGMEIFEGWRCLYMAASPDRMRIQQEY